MPFVRKYLKRSSSEARFPSKVCFSHKIMTAPAGISFYSSGRGCRGTGLFVSRPRRWRQSEFFVKKNRNFETDRKTSLPDSRRFTDICRSLSKAKTEKDRPRTQIGAWVRGKRLNEASTFPVDFPVSGKMASGNKTIVETAVNVDCSQSRIFSWDVNLSE